MKITKAQLKRLIKEELGGMQETHGVDAIDEDLGRSNPEVFFMVQKLAMEIAGMSTYVPPHAPSMASTHVRTEWMDIARAILDAIKPYVEAAQEDPEV